MVGVGLYVRPTVMDSPDFTTVKKEKAVVKAPVLRARLRHQKVGFTKDELLGDTMVAAALGMISVPFFGFLSDLIGRRLMYGIGIVPTAIFAFPYFGLLNTQSGRNGCWPLSSRCSSMTCSTARRPP